MSRRWRLLLAGPLAAVLLATGCGIPDSTDVRSLGPGPSNGTSTDDDIPPIRHSRESTTDPKTFAAYYLEAAAGEPNGAMDRVKQFLSPAAADSFKASPELHVVNLTEDVLVNPGSDEVTLSARTIGVLGSNGVLDPVSDATKTEYKLTISTVSGQNGLFVTKAPQVLLLTDDALNEFYERRNLYFWNRERTGLVPDMRYLSRDLPGEQEPNEIVKWLIEGPSPWLEGAVETLPEGTALDGNVPAVNNDKLQINLSGPAVQPPDDPEALERLRRQLMWSLRANLPRTLELRVGSQEQTDYQGTGYYTSNPAYSLATSPQRFLIYRGQIRRMSRSPNATDAVPVVRPEANRNVRAAALAGSGTRQYAALVVDNGNRQVLRVGAAALGEQTDLAQVRLPAGVTGQPVWAVTSADPRTPAIGLITVAGRLYSFSSDGSALTVVDGAGPRSGITAVAVAPDGRRVALISGSGLSVVALSTGGDVQTLEPRHVLTPSLRQISAVDWSSETWLTVAGTFDDSNRVGIIEMPLDGSSVSPRLDDIGTERVTYLTAYPVSPVSGTESSDTIAYVAGAAAFDVLSVAQRITVADLADPVANPPAGVAPGAPFFLR